MIAYISGPMTGIKYYNFPEFNDVEFFLKKKGFEIINPVDITLKVLKKFIPNLFLNPEDYDGIEKICQQHPEISYETFLEEDLKEIEKCHCIIMLSGWKNSKGSLKEYEHAKENNLVLYELKGKKLIKIDNL